MQIITDQSPLCHSREDSEHEQMEDSKMHKCARVASVNSEVPSLSSEEMEGGERLPKAGQCHVQTSPLLPTLGDDGHCSPYLWYLSNGHHSLLNGIKVSKWHLDDVCSSWSCVYAYTRVVQYLQIGTFCIKYSI